MELSMEDQSYYRAGIVQELENYAAARRASVLRGAETPELAALLTEKFGYGVAKALFVLHFDLGDIYAETNRLVLEIDPTALENRQKRWNARPAGLTGNVFMIDPTQPSSATRSDADPGGSAV